MRRIEICENGLNMVWELTDQNEIKLLHFSALPFDEADLTSDTDAVLLSGGDLDIRAGPGRRAAWIEIHPDGARIPYEV